jgi:hypothetical protein
VCSFLTGYMQVPADRYREAGLEPASYVGLKSRTTPDVLTMC